MMIEGEPRFKTNWLVWPVDRPDRTFRTYVVEPREYSPEHHPAIFFAAFQPFQPMAQPEYLSGAMDIDPLPHPDFPDRFDLLTFPEAFLPSETLIVFLQTIGRSPIPLGCVHAGLRPNSKKKDTHLFETSALSALLARLRQIPALVGDDLEPFSNWLDAQSPSDMFNIGCLFTLDADRKIRICLHPKLVRSQFEENPFHDKTMKEANLLSLVTLRPRDASLYLTTIHPLICSDALNLSTDQQNNHPIPAITSARRFFCGPPAEHVDIVSVAACTPTDVAKTKQPMRAWKREFRDTFIEAAGKDQSHRHRFAMFTLSNFHMLKTSPGGLSGAFVPLPLHRNVYQHPLISGHRSIYGYFPDTEELTEPQKWVEANEEYRRRAQKTGLGYIVALNPNEYSHDALASMLGFTITRLPRDANRWERDCGVIDISLHEALISSGAIESKLQFKRRSFHD